MIKLALLSFWHVHAQDYANQAANHPDTEIVALWDEDPVRGAAHAAANGWRWYADLDELLRQPEIEGVIVTTPTNAHPAVIGAALRAGKHVYTEKVLAIAPADAADLIETARANQAILYISLPRLSAGYTQRIRQLLAESAIGDVTYARVRLTHDGALAGWLPEHFYDPVAAGGGALIDLGCHPLYLLSDLFGFPHAIAAVFGSTSGHAVEDHAVALFSYPHGLIGVAEVGFVSAHEFSIEIHGTQGDIAFVERERELRVARGRGADRAWRAETIPPDTATPFERWVACIHGRDDNAANLALAYDLTRLTDGATRAAATGTRIALTD